MFIFRGLSKTLIITIIIYIWREYELIVLISWFAWQAFIFRSLPLFGFIAISIISIKGLKTLGAHLDQSYNEITPNLDYLGRMGVARAQIGFYLWAVVAINDDQKERDGFIVLAKEMVQNYKSAMKSTKAPNIKRAKPNCMRP